MSNDLPLKVIPVSVDSLRTVHDYADTVDGGWKLWDFVPDFIADYWWVILICALVVLPCGGDNILPQEEGGKHTSAEETCSSVRTGHAGSYKAQE